jgi:hemolysin III
MIATKPLLRGWFHAAASVASLALTVVLCLMAHTDALRLFAVLIFSLSMVELYTVSATYHIGTGFWSKATARRLRALDHANIFVLIAGTYTPLCIALLTGWLRLTILVLIWGLAVGRFWWDRDGLACSRQIVSEPGIGEQSIVRDAVKVAG